MYTDLWLGSLMLGASHTIFIFAEQNSYNSYNPPVDMIKFQFLIDQRFAQESTGEAHELSVIVILRNILYVHIEM